MKITLLDPKQISDPEVTAMLLAFYSRSSLPIQDRLNSLGENEKTIKESLKKYYLGYGHSSIGDCGDATIFLEGISMLAAKAFESNSLFNGQESSSRYIDFSTQKIIDPINNYDSEKVLTKWVDFYSEVQEPIQKFLMEKFPIKENQSYITYENAIKAKCFDITRSLLPAGICTQVGIKMGFRPLLEHLWKLECHPMKEVQVIAENTLTKLVNKFPSSFKFCPENIKFYFKDISKSEFFTKYQTELSEFSIIDNIDKSIHDDVFLEVHRPKNCLLSSRLAEYGTMRINFTLDYGSWRDLQRHRNTISNKCSVLSEHKIFNKDYYSFLPDNLKNKFDIFIQDQYKCILKLTKSKDKCISSYYYPLGNLVNAHLVLTFPELIYILELRSSKSVHFTLRKLIHQIWNSIKDKYYLQNNYIDESESDFYFNRGNQTIKEI